MPFLALAISEEVPFRLLDNPSDGLADNPAMFHQPPLREEQRQSLALMLKQEARPNSLEGGLLADKMGYGKTATMIGLIAHDLAGQPKAKTKCGQDAALSIKPDHTGYILI